MQTIDPSLHGSWYASSKIRTTSFRRILA